MIDWVSMVRHSRRRFSNYMYAVPSKVRKRRRQFVPPSIVANIQKTRKRREQKDQDVPHTRSSNWPSSMTGYESDSYSTSEASQQDEVGGNGGNGSSCSRLGRLQQLRTQFQGRRDPSSGNENNDVTNSSAATNSSSKKSLRSHNNKNWSRAPCDLCGCLLYRNVSFLSFS